MAFVVVKNLPTGEILPQLTWAQPVLSRFFAPLRGVNDHQHRATRAHSLLSWIDQIPLQIVRDQHQIERIYRWRVPTLQIRDLRGDGEPSRCHSPL